MDSWSFCAAIAWKLLCLPWACLPKSVRAHCLLVATFCSHHCHIALITSLPCLEHLITATTMCLGWQVPRLELRLQKDCDCGWVKRQQIPMQPQALENPSTRAGGCPKEAMLSCLCWNWLLAEPVAQWKEEPTLEQVWCWKDLKQPAPEWWTLWEGPSGAAVHGELEAMGGTQIGEVQGGLSLWVLCQSREQCETALQCVLKAAGPTLTQLWSPIAPHTTNTSHVLSDHPKRWSPKSQTKLSQWRSVDNLQAWCTDHRNDTYVLRAKDGKGWWLRRLYWVVCDLSMR